MLINTGSSWWFLRTILSHSLRLCLPQPRSAAPGQTLPDEAVGSPLSGSPLQSPPRPLHPARPLPSRVLCMFNTESFPPSSQQQGRHTASIWKPSWASQYTPRKCGSSSSLKKPPSRLPPLTGSLCRRPGGRTACPSKPALLCPSPTHVLTTCTCGVGRKPRSHASREAEGPGILKEQHTVEAREETTEEA